MPWQGWQSGNERDPQALNKKPMLTAIVVHKHGDMQPGPGFFELAKSLGRNTKDPLACWIQEFNRTHDLWANRDGRI